MLKDLININIVKLQVTKWVERTENKEDGISNLVNRGTGRNNCTLLLYDRNLLLYNGNLTLPAILY